MSRCSAIALSFLLASALASAAVAAPKVAVTIKPIHSLVAQVMADIAVPTLIVDGAASPHAFSLKPSKARAISEADVFIRISEQLEPFTKKPVEALSKSVRVVSLMEAPGLTLLAPRRGDTFESDDHHHGDSDSFQDGHIWLDPRNARIIIDQLAGVLSEVDPSNAATYAANAAKANAGIEALEARLSGELNPYKNKPFIVFHDATQYFEARFGLAAAGSITVSPEVQPSARRLTAVRKKLAALGAGCVFAEPGFQPKLIDAITEGTSSKQGTLDPEGIMLMPGPRLYEELMTGLASSITSCLAP